MSKTKIIVLHLKEIIYTGIFVGLGILFLLLLFFMFFSKDSKATMNDIEKKYQPGVYTSQLCFNDTALNLEVIVDENHINSISLWNIDESVSAMYPLLEPSLENIETQLCNNTDIADLQLDENSKYTETLLLDAITLTLEKAAVTNEK